MEAFFLSGAADIFIVVCMVAFVVSTTRFAVASPAAFVTRRTVIGHAISIFRTSLAGASVARTITFAFTTGAGETNAKVVIGPAAGIEIVVTIALTFPDFHTRTHEGDEAIHLGRVAETVHAFLMIRTITTEGDLAFTVGTDNGLIHYARGATIFI